MKIVLTCMFLVASTYSIGQVEKTNTEIRNDHSGFKIEFFAFPGAIFNHANIGFSYKTASALEHNLSLGSWYELSYGKSFNLNLSYNLNTYFKNNKNYIPVWFKVANTRKDVGYEEGYHPHILRFSIGSGFGRLFEIGEKWGLRTEIGLGASANLTNSSGKVLSLDLNLSEYAFDQYYPDQNPRVVPTFRFKIAFVRVLGKKNHNRVDDREH